MDSEISSAWSLLLVGMVTVFIVLFLVVLTGNLLTLLVNAISKSNLPNSISDKKIAAITAAVAIVTQGTGQIKSIKKK